LEEEQQNHSTPASEEATTVGMFLKYTRLKQKKSIEAVSDALCIRKVYLKALEEDDYETLPPVPYGVGFVRSYASYLGLNAQRIVQVYKQQAFPQKEKTAQQPLLKKHSALTIPNKKYIYFGLMAAVVLYIVWFSTHSLFTHDKMSEASQESSEVEMIEVMPVDEEPDVELIVSEPVQSDAIPSSVQDNIAPQVVIVESSYTEEPQPQLKQDEITLKLKGESWIELKDKKKVYVSGIRQKGFELTTPYTAGMILSLGKYYNVDVYINGILTQVAGPRKQTNINLDKFIKH